VRINDQSFKDEIAGVEKPLLVLFMSSFCGPSHALFPVLDALYEGHDERFEYGEVDVEKCPVMTRTFEVKGTPTLIAFNKGEPIGSRAGTMSPEFLEKFLTDMLSRITG
jgi:thioredoxin 1